MEPWSSSRPATICQGSEIPLSFWADTWQDLEIDEKGDFPDLCMLSVQFVIEEEKRVDDPSCFDVHATYPKAVQPFCSQSLRRRLSSELQERALSGANERLQTRGIEGPEYDVGARLNA